MQALLNNLFRLIGNAPLTVGLLGTLGSLLVVAVPFWLIASGEANALNHAREKSESIVSIIAQNMERNGYIYDTQLKSLVLNAEDPRIWQLPADIRHRLLFLDMPPDAYLDGQFLVDKQGRIIAAHFPGTLTPGLLLSDREYFRVHMQNPDAGLYVSSPFQSRISPGKASIALSRRVNDANGNFAGIAFLLLRIEFAQRMFEYINTEDTGNVGIVLTDGTIIASKPYKEQDVGAKITDLPFFKKIGTNTRGTITGTSRDGSERLYTFRAISNLPIIIIVAPSIAKVKQHWQQQMFITRIVTLALGVVLTLGGWILAFTLRDKLKTQDRLTSLATTDALTKMNNRRVLTERLEQAWRQAVQNRQFLSVLFIDIDRFKRFNDIHGHAIGDQKLIQVAHCIMQEIRPHDVAARYGGEEFVVVLPDTGHEEATCIAEAIRLRVLAQAITHEGSDTGLLTISIGCASYFPGHGGTPDRLLTAADNQLYLAKARGRNQVQSITVSRELFTAPK